jgi:transcriptional regulator GlxA family with amidase domain
VIEMSGSDIDEQIRPHRDSCYTRDVMGESSPVIAFLAVSPFELLDLTGPASVFQRTPDYNKPYYSVQILSAEPRGFVRSNGGVSISANCQFSEYQGPIDTLIVIGGEGAIGPQPAELLDRLRKRSIRARRIPGVTASVLGRNRAKASGDGMVAK